MEQMVEFRVVGGQSLFERLEGSDGKSAMRMKKERPGRKLGAERRRLAREELSKFYETEQFSQLPRKIQLALTVLCPPDRRPR